MILFFLTGGFLRRKNERKSICVIHDKGEMSAKSTYWYHSSLFLKNGYLFVYKREENGNECFIKSVLKRKESNLSVCGSQLTIFCPIFFCCC